MSHYLIFTDLDGTLLNHHDYSFTQALPALKKIRRLNIPLIINSSKTYAEIKEIRKQLHNNWAFAVENGAVVFSQTHSLSGNDSDMKQTILGRAQADLLEIVHALREKHSFSFTGFSDYSVAELMKETGLTKAQSVRAKQRLASEPLKWQDSEKQLILFKQELEMQDLQLIQGGRFLHVMGQNDKSKAMAWLLNKFNQQSKQTIALGDSQNDLSMLEQADVAAIIRKQDDSYLQLNKNSDQVVYSQHPAPLGWQEVMDQLFIKLNLGEDK